MSVHIELVAEIDLTADQDAGIAALLAQCFGTDFGGRSFYQQRHHLRLLAWEVGLIGHVALGFRAVRLGGELISIIGLAEVATHPDHRGQGIATLLLRRAVALAKTSLAQHLLLFGTAQLYAAQGFLPQANPMIWTEMSDARTGEMRQARADGLMVLALQDRAWDGTAPLDLLGHQF